MTNEQLIAKTYLEQLGTIGGEIKARKYAIEKEWKTVVGGMGNGHLTSQISLAPAKKTKKYRWNAENINHYLKLRDEQQLKIQALIQKRNVLMKMIDDIIEVRLRTLLIERYMNQRSWEEIARFMKYSEAYTRKELHGMALESFYKILVHSDFYKSRK